METATTSTPTSTFTLNPITSAEANALREAGGIHYVADTKPGFPCRQCLVDAEVGEELVLVSHTPFDASSPYRSASPIFLHVHDCGGPVESAKVPLQISGRQLSVRSFDSEEMMIAAVVVDGEHLESTIDSYFADPASDKIHVHFAMRGCWATNVERLGL